MSKKMKITVTAAVIAVIMLVMSVAVYAASHRWYEELHIASGAQILKGSLQVSKDANNIKFVNINAVLRYDPSDPNYPHAGYQLLDMKINVIGKWNGRKAYEDDVVGTNIAVGGYITTTPTDVSDRKFNEIECYYYSKTPQSDTYTMNLSIFVDVNTPSD